MANRPNFAAAMQAEKLPVRNGHQYRAAPVKLLDDKCTGCAAAHNKALCDALPPCGRSSRMDGMNVVFVDCGPAKAAPQVKRVENGRGGTMWLHVPTSERVEVIGEGMAGMTEVEFSDGHVIHACQKDLMPV